MIALSDKTARRLLTIMRQHTNLKATPDNAGLRALVERGHATSEQVGTPHGTHLNDRIYRLTPAGLAWLADPAQPAFIRESTKTQPGSIEHALRAAIMALRSYQHGNAASDLAESIADAGDEALRAAGLPPATLGGKW